MSGSWTGLDWIHCRMDSDWTGLIQTNPFHTLLLGVVFQGALKREYYFMTVHASYVIANKCGIAIPYSMRYPDVPIVVPTLMEPWDALRCVFATQHFSFFEK